MGKLCARLASGAEAGLQVSKIQRYYRFPDVRMGSGGNVAGGTI
jgi:hypothetical protein